MLFSRGWIARDFGEAPSAVQAAVWLDCKRTYMDLRPHLRRIYTAVRDAATYGPMVMPLGFEVLPGDSIDFDGIVYLQAVNDFGPSSIDGWLSRLIAAELLVEEDSILDVTQRQLVVDGRRIALTRTEFEMLNYLYERPGKVVERSALIRDVWGYDYAGGSNVIEATVKSTRRKLGSRAAAIETVRGVGYRFVASA